MSNQLIEALEDRRLLSAVHPLAVHLIRPQNIMGIQRWRPWLGNLEDD